MRSYEGALPGMMTPYVAENRSLRDPKIQFYTQDAGPLLIMGLDDGSKLGRWLRY